MALHLSSVSDWISLTFDLIRFFDSWDLEPKPTLWNNGWLPLKSMASFSHLIQWLVIIDVNGFIFNIDISTGVVLRFRLAHKKDSLYCDQSCPTSHIRHSPYSMDAAWSVGIWIQCNFYSSRGSGLVRESLTLWLFLPADQHHCRRGRLVDLATVLPVHTLLTTHLQIGENVIVKFDTVLLKCWLYCYNITNRLSSRWN